MKNVRPQEQAEKPRINCALGVNPEYEKARAKHFAEQSRRIRKHFGISNKVRAKCDSSDAGRKDSKD